MIDLKKHQEMLAKRNEAFQMRKNLMNASLKNILENSPLYTSNKVVVAESLEKYEFMPLQLICKKCKKETTHRFDESGSDFDSNLISRRVTGGPGPDVFPTLDKTFKFSYECQLCQINSYVFLLTFKKDSIIKVGQYPSLDNNIPKDIEDKLGPDLAAHFKKGTICLNQGYGIAAFAYYRRVVEDKVLDLIKEIEQIATIEEKTEIAKMATGISSTHNFDEKAKFITDSIPSALRPSGNNLLKTLFSCISEGLHKKSDEECNHIAKTVGELLVAIIHILNTQAEAAKTVERLASKLPKS